MTKDPKSWQSEDAFVFGLSKERPILDHHPKAHIHEIRRISGEIRRISKDQLPGMVSPVFFFFLRPPN